MNLENLHNSIFASRMSRLATLAGLLLLAYLSYVGALSSVTDGIGGNYVDGINRSYLKSAGQRATELIEVLGASKVALAILASSEGGISFFIDIQVRLGQSLSAIYDMVNYAWLFALVSLAATKALELLLDLSRLSMAPVLTLFFCSLGLCVGFFSRFPAIALLLSGLARYLLFGALLVHFVIPLSVYGIAAAGDGYFNQHKKEVFENFQSIQSFMPTHDSEEGLHSQVERSIKHFKDNQSALHKGSSSLSNLTVRHIVLVFAEYLIVPIIFLYVLSALVMKLIDRVWTKWEGLFYTGQIARSCKSN